MRRGRPARPTAPSTVVEWQLYADLAHRMFERSYATLHHARLGAAALRRAGFDTTIRAAHRDADGRSWCETVEQVRRDGTLYFGC